MKISFFCTHCIHDGAVGPPDTVLVEILDRGAYRFECARGHKTAMVLQDLKFELLFDLALNAILDGYYREAVLSFASALERFQQFAVNIYCRKQRVGKQDAVDAWALVARQSERQLGAYVFAHLLLHKERPVLLSNKKAEFRNRVVHGGYIPSRKEAIDFGDAVRDLLVAGTRLAREQYQPEVVWEMHLALQASIAELSEPGPFVTSAAARWLSLAQPDSDAKNVEELLYRLAGSRQLDVAIHSLVASNGVAKSQPPTGAPDGNFDGK